MQVNLQSPASLQALINPDLPAAQHRRSMLERMPKWLICIPLTLQWLWLAFRYRSFTLPTVVNPAITAGGLVGEGKLEYFSRMGPLARAATARYCAISTHCMPPPSELRKAMRATGLSFPVIAKPDLGLCGYGVRLIANSDDLQTYLRAFPVNEMVVLQQWLPQEGEAGIFYVREPEARHGRIIGLTLRYFPRVTGDGTHTLAELIAADPRARRLVSSAQHDCTYDAERIPTAGELVRLATIGSTRVGGLYRDGGAYITAQLTQAIDAIAQDMPSFHFGRFDVRFDNLQDLSQGLGLKIMEINGAGSEAIQAWDPDTRILDGFRMIFEKQRILFAIGEQLRSQGFKPIGLLALIQLNHRQLRLIARYPASN